MALAQRIPTQHDDDSFIERFASDVRTGLQTSGQKSLPSQYLYDAVGSALFDTICLLDAYGLSRAGERLLVRHRAALPPLLQGAPRVVELGSGSGKKTRLLLQNLAQVLGGVRYLPIDISPAALEVCQRELADVAGVSVEPLACSYLDGLQRAVAGRHAGEQVLVLFLGSTIGNFEAEAAAQFMRHLRASLLPGDLLLLATDLVKPVQQMLPAYDDPAGVTAAFNRNILLHVNRVLDGTFELRHFAHEARYDASSQRIEMHLRVLENHEATIRRAGITVPLRFGETLWTESSHKFTKRSVRELAQDASFSCTVQWTDDAWPFAHSLLEAC